jgi:hypothetical protein
MIEVHRLQPHPDRVCQVKGCHCKAVGGMDALIVFNRDVFRDPMVSVCRGHMRLLSSKIIMSDIRIKDGNPQGGYKLLQVYNLREHKP